MKVVVKTLKNERTYNKVDLINFEKGKFYIYQTGKKYPVRIIDQYDLVFYCIMQ